MNLINSPHLSNTFPNFQQKEAKECIAHRTAGAFRCAKPMPGCSMGPTLFDTDTLLSKNIKKLYPHSLIEAYRIWGGLKIIPTLFYTDIPKINIQKK